MDDELRKEIKKKADGMFNRIINRLNRLLSDGWSIKLQKKIIRDNKESSGFVDEENKLILIKSYPKKMRSRVLLHEVFHFLVFFDAYLKKDEYLYEFLELVLWFFLDDEQKKILESYIPKSPS